METPEDQDPVWKLLKQTRSVEPSPFFSRNVIREVRKLDDSASGSWLSGLVALLRNPSMASGALAVFAVVLAILYALVFPKPEPIEIADTDYPYGSEVRPQPADLIEEQTSFDPASEMEAVEYLGQLMVVADPGQLSDEALGDLFF